MLLYTLKQKKRGILFLTITFANLNPFLQILHHFNREEILNATAVIFLSHCPMYVRTLPEKIKTNVFAVIHQT